MIRGGMSRRRRSPPLVTSKGRGGALHHGAEAEPQELTPEAPRARYRPRLSHSSGPAPWEPPGLHVSLRPVSLSKALLQGPARGGRGAEGAREGQGVATRQAKALIQGPAAGPCVCVRARVCVCVCVSLQKCHRGPPHSTAAIIKALNQLTTHGKRKH